MMKEVEEETQEVITHANVKEESVAEEEMKTSERLPADVNGDGKVDEKKSDVSWIQA